MDELIASLNRASARLKHEAAREGGHPDARDHWHTVKALAAALTLARQLGTDPLMPTDAR